MSAADVDIVIEQGVDWSQLFRMEEPIDVPVSLVGYTNPRWQIRASYAAASPLLSMTEGAGIVLGGALGTISLSLTDTQTSGLPLPATLPTQLRCGTPAAVIGVYDVFMTDPLGLETKPMGGRVLLKPRVTR